MAITEKTQKRLSSNLWYHATLLKDFESICKSGIIVNYNKGNELDYGYGFYLMPNAQDSENWIKRLHKGESDKSVVIEFEFCPLIWFEDSGYNTRIFDAYNNDFAEFVLFNRTENANGERQHEFDCIYGVMSDSFPLRLVLDLKSGIITREIVIEELKKSTSVKQLSLHSQKLCDTIVMRRAYIFDRDSSQRKELELRAYSKRKDDSEC